MIHVSLRFSTIEETGRFRRDAGGFRATPSSCFIWLLKFTIAYILDKGPYLLYILHPVCLYTAADIDAPGVNLADGCADVFGCQAAGQQDRYLLRSEEHTSELQSHS